MNLNIVEPPFSSRTDLFGYVLSVSEGIPVMNSLSPLIHDCVELISDRMEIEGLLLFGSYARGDFTSESDMDFLTLGDEFQRKIFKDTNPEIEVWTHPVQHYSKIIDGIVSDPFNDSLFLGILQESIIIYEDSKSIFVEGKKSANTWSWSDDVIEDLLKRQEKALDLISKSGTYEPVLKHIKQRAGLFTWNNQRASSGLPLLRRLKDIHRKDAEAKIGSIVNRSTIEEKRRLHDLFTSLANGVLAESKREPFTEIKDTIKSFTASRFNEWILSMADSLVFLAAMGMSNRGLSIEWKLLDVDSEVRLLEESIKEWEDYGLLYNEFSRFIAI